MTAAVQRKPRTLDKLSGDPRRDAILAFIAGHHATYGYAPTVREISAGVGLRGPAPAVYHLAILEAAGCITRTPGIARSIRVVEA